MKTKKMIGWAVVSNFGLDSSIIGLPQFDIYEDKKVAQSVAEHWWDKFGKEADEKFTAVRCEITFKVKK